VRLSKDPAPCISAHVPRSDDWAHPFPRKRNSVMAITAGPPRVS